MCSDLSQHWSTAAAMAAAQYGLSASQLPLLLHPAPLRESTLQLWLEHPPAFAIREAMQNPMLPTDSRNKSSSALIVVICCKCSDWQS